MTQGHATSDNVATIRRRFDEVWNEGREETIDELFDEQVVAHGLAETDAEPPDADDALPSLD